MQLQMQLSASASGASGRHAHACARRAAPPRPAAAFRPARTHRQCSSAVPRRAWQRAGRLRAAGEDYTAITERLEAAAAETKEGLQGTSIYLVGMMGSGKSTVGKLVASALGYCFFDTDAIIEQLAGKPVAEIFSEDGEAAFRDIETQVVSELAPFSSCVVATGGGVVTRGENWGHMHGGVCVWLRGSPELLAHRVVADGTGRRPLLAQEGQEGDAYQQAVARLSALLEARREQYGYADITVPLEGAGPQAELGAPTAVVALRVLEAISQRIKSDAEMRAERMKFEIVQDELPATMRVMQGKGPQDDDPLLP